MGVSDDIVSQARIYIDGPMGNFKLIRVENVNVTEQSKVEVITALGVQQGAGLRYTEGGFELTMSVFREQGTPEVNWRAEKKKKTRFAITLQDDGGQREQYWCAVASVDRKDDDKGSHMDEVKLVATRRQDLPTLG